MSTKGSVSVGRKVAYGFGSVAFGVKSYGFDYFFLIFYSQVMGGGCKITHPCSDQNFCKDKINS